MRCKISFSLIIISVGLVVQSCSSTRTKADKPSKSETHLVKSDSGKTIRIKKGEGFEITLNECVGCAEVWGIEKTDESKIRFISNTYSGRSCEDCDGGYQNNSFHFQVLAPGTSTVVLTYFEEKVSLTIEGY
ncbi:MAG: protease inhibitor I42 family protein [Bacteroidota bacterium]